MKILLIDDDKASMQYYVEELGDANFQVTHCRKPDTALSSLEENPTAYSLIILDSAMPPGERYASMQTESGTLTGKLLFQDIRTKCPNTPILVLTNFPGLDWVKVACESPNVVAARKLDKTPRGLVTLVQEMISFGNK